MGSFFGSSGPGLAPSERSSCTSPDRVVHGFSLPWQHDLFGAFGGPGAREFAMHHHWPVVVGYLVGLAQVGGGLAIVSGILFRLGTAAVAIVMLGAIFFVHLPHGFDVSSGGVEFALTELLVALALFITGPGMYRADRLFLASQRMYFSQTVVES